MASVQVYSDEYGEIQCDQEKRLVQVRWSTHCSGLALRELLLEALRHAASHHLTAWLCDMRKLHYMEMADQNWLMRVFFPSFDKHHRHRVAFVVNIHNFALMSSVQTQNMVLHDPSIAGVLDLDFFLSGDGAEHWLLKAG